MSWPPLRARPARRDGQSDAASRPVQAGCDFGCEDCGSPAVLLPSDLSGQALVLCDQCRRPLATLAAFRAYVDRLTAGARVCDHHLTSCHARQAEPSSSTARASN